MEEIPKQPDQDSSAREAKDAAVEERSWNLGCGLALVIVGAGGLAQKMGWIPEGDWLWSAGLLGIGVGYLYKAFRK
jgi:hypothetical protein